MTNEEMLSIHGGAISASLINAVVRGFGLIVLVGQYAGSAVRRMTKKNYC